MYEGTEGQDRDNYSDTQDRDSYEVDPARETETALVVEPHGAFRRIMFAVGESYALIRKAIGNTIDYQELDVQTIDKTIRVGFFLDDEGKVVQHPTPNAFVSLLWALNYGFEAGYIAGTVVFVGSALDNEGNTLGLTTDVLETLETTLRLYTDLTPKLYVEQDGDLIRVLLDEDD